MADHKFISVDHSKREQFRKAYNAAVKLNQEIFVFDGNEFLTRYAKYLLEYLDMQAMEK